MKILSIQQVVVGVVFTLSSMLAQADIKRVDFSYTPDNSPATPKLTGQFTYDTTNIGSDNMVNADELNSFYFTLTNNVMSVKTDLALMKATNNIVFNYDAANNTFAFGAGQQTWYNSNSEAAGTSFGIFSGRGPTLVSMRLSTYVNGVFTINSDAKNVTAAQNLFKYTVSTVTMSAVPEPETYGMLGLGLAVISAVVRRRK